MKAILGLMVLVSSVASAQSAYDAFAPESCSGSLMSSNRAVYLLDNQTSVNLSEKQSVSTTVRNGFYRWRNVVNRTPGAWNHDISYQPIAPVLRNNAGKLEFEVLIYDRSTSYQLGYTLCKLAGKGKLDKLTGAYYNYTCVVPKGANKAPIAWGQTKFFATLTDRCLRMWSRKSPSGSDHEWAYLLYY